MFAVTDWFFWVTDSDLKTGLGYLLAGNKLDQAAAVSLTKKLVSVGAQYIQASVGPNFYIKNFPTSRHGSTWSAGNPIGWVDHYTAGINARGALMWFSNMDRGPSGGNSSAHFVIDYDGTIMTVVDPLTTIAWHATVANSSHIGCEIVNAGLLGKDPNGGYTYLGSPAYPKDRWPNIFFSPDGRPWEPYTPQQIIANLCLKRLLLCAIPGLRPDRFTDHQAIDPARKIDCGPHWPLAHLNRLVFSWAGIVEEFDWMIPKTISPKDLKSFNNDVDIDLAPSA